jgi:hypothetical protein
MLPAEIAGLVAIFCKAVQAGNFCPGKNCPGNCEGNRVIVPRVLPAYSNLPECGAIARNRGHGLSAFRDFPDCSHRAKPCNHAISVIALPGLVAIFFNAVQAGRGLKAPWWWNRTACRPCARGWSQFCRAKLLLAHATWVPALGGNAPTFFPALSCPCPPVCPVVHFFRPRHIDTTEFCVVKC